MRILEKLEHPFTEDDVVKLNVYLSPKDGKRILGYSDSIAYVSDNVASFIQIPFGTTIEKAFESAKILAETHGRQAVLIKDPKGLFPSSNWA